MSIANDRFQLPANARGSSGGLVLCVVLLAAGRLYADDWPTYQHDSGHTGRSPADFNPTLLKKAWGTPLGTRWFDNPVVVGNTLYTLQDGLTSYNLLNGAKNWSHTYATSISSYPTYSEGMLIFTLNSGSTLCVVDATTGQQK